MLGDDVGSGGGMVQEGGGLCMPSADSHWCAAETNTTLQSKGNYKQGEKTILRMGENDSK